MQMVQEDFAQGSNTQNVDWIQSFLEMTGGAPLPQPQTQSQSQNQAQAQVGADPQAAAVPTPAEMDATWQALVAQLGI